MVQPTVVDLPASMGWLPRDKHHRPVPFFVAWTAEAGGPDFRIADPRRMDMAVNQGLCWVCGGHLDRGEPAAFLIGPMCVVNHVSAEPPSHRDCALYSVMHCPFLFNPNMRRRPIEHDGTVPAAGVMIERNPGVIALWMSRTWWDFRAPDGGRLFDIGPVPAELWWYSQGRPATREQIVDSIESGLPALMGAAADEDERALVRELADGVICQLLPD